MQLQFVKVLVVFFCFFVFFLLEYVASWFLYLFIVVLALKRNGDSKCMIVITTSTKKLLKTECVGTIKLEFEHD